METFKYTGSICFNFVGSSQRLYLLERGWQDSESSDQHSACSPPHHRLWDFQSSFHCIVHNELRFHPYKIQMMQQLEDTYKIIQVAFCMQFITSQILLQRHSNQTIVPDHSKSPSITSNSHADSTDSWKDKQADLKTFSSCGDIVVRYL
jgi:hypothetical protein